MSRPESRVVARAAFVLLAVAALSANACSSGTSGATCTDPMTSSRTVGTRAVGLGGSCKGAEVCSSEVACVCADGSRNGSGLQCDESVTCSWVACDAFCSERGGRVTPHDVPSSEGSSGSSGDAETAASPCVPSGGSSGSTAGSSGSAGSSGEGTSGSSGTSGTSGSSGSTGTSGSSGTSGTSGGGGVACSNLNVDACSCVNNPSSPANAEACGSSSLGDPGACCADPGWPSSGTSCSCHSFLCDANSGGGYDCFYRGLSAGDVRKPTASAPSGGACCIKGPICSCYSSSSKSSCDGFPSVSSCTASALPACTSILDTKGSTQVSSCR